MLSRQRLRLLQETTTVRRKVRVQKEKVKREKEKEKERAVKAKVAAKLGRKLVRNTLAGTITVATIDELLPADLEKVAFSHTRSLASPSSKRWLRRNLTVEATVLAFRVILPHQVTMVVRKETRT